MNLAVRAVPPSRGRGGVITTTTTTTPYLIKLEWGLIICRNRIHLHKRLISPVTEHHNLSFPGTDTGIEEDGPRRTRQAFD